MNATWAICRRDLIAAFASPLMWLVLATWSAITGFFFWLRLFLVHGTAGTETPLFAWGLISGFFALCLLAPAVTMSSFAAERNQGTMQLLLTVPIRERHLVLGKFLAAFVCLAALVTATAIQPAVLCFISEVPAPQLAAGYVGLVLAAALFAAAGVWVSLVVDSPVSAYVITFGVLAVLLLVSFLGNEGPLGTLSHSLGLWRRTESFFRGEAALGDAAYFVGGSALFLVMGHSVLCARRIHG